MDKYKGRKVNITVNHIKMINNLNNAKRKSDKLILFSLIYFSQIFADKDGIFGATYNSLAYRVGVSSDSAVRAVDNLISIGYLEAVQRNKRIIGDHFCDKAPNKYRLLIDMSNNPDDIIYSFEFSNNIYIHFINCYTICYKQLKFNNVPRWIRDAINKHRKNSSSILNTD
jgi:hypothetical protein